MKNFKEDYLGTLDGFENFKQADYDNTGYFLNENGEYEAIENFKSIEDLNRWLEVDYQEFLEANEDFLALNEAAALKVTSDIPNFMSVNA
ncbi:MAG TPA: hypothetical protein VGC17_08840 [Lactovum miscens]|uniref:hypothetical protein n=1 Tax=Lactovum miscens TaxID=190387 RepID=UPI002EDB4BA7